MPKGSTNNLYSPEIIAHRGSKEKAPENSLEAIAHAISIGVKKIEIDVQMLADKTLILMHDPILDRTTNGSGIVRTKTLEEIREFKIDQRVEGIKFNTDIPTLTQVLELIKDTKVKLLVEVKYARFTPGLADELDKLLRQYQMVERSQVFSFETKFIKEFRGKFPEYKMGELCLNPFKKFSHKQIDHIGIFFTTVLLFRWRVKALQRKGFKVYAWTANKPRAMRRLTKMKIDGIITDYPQRYFDNFKQQ